MSWNIFTTATAKRQLKRLPEHIAFRLLEIFESMKQDPWQGDILKLGGTVNAWRRRVGEYRFKFRVFPENHTIQIYEVERRTSSSY